MSGALIVGAGGGISASCARLFVAAGMPVSMAARTPDKPELRSLADELGVQVYGCDAADPDSVRTLFEQVVSAQGVPGLVVHNIDGRMPSIFRKALVDADPADVLQVLKNSTYSAFLVGQQAAKYMLSQPLDAQGRRGSILFTNASGALKGFAKSGAFAAACHGKSGLAQSMARELMPDGIHVAHIPIDAAIGVTQTDGSRAHWAAGTSEDDNMADPDRIAEVYLQLHQQHRSTWAYEVTLRPWVEKW